jgi:hypothetical protein
MLRIPRVTPGGEGEEQHPDAPLHGPAVPER